jgi:acetyl-CoA carboxylase biotin carboxyl carrier protein
MDPREDTRMDLKLIQKLIRMMKHDGLGELELEDQKSGLRVRLKRAGEAPPPSAPLVQLMHGAVPAHMPAQPTLPAAGQAAVKAGEPAAPLAPAGTPIVSPMVGTFYRAPSPDAEPFVSVGTKISVDSRLCIIEAMKVMNEIKSEIEGEILEILVENGEPIEFGQPLFLVKTS